MSTLDDLVEALMAVEYGVAVLDQSLRSTFINRAFRNMWNLPDSVADNRPYFADVLLHGRNQGYYDISDEELDAYLERRLAAIRRGTDGPVELERTDGITLRLDVIVLPSGGRMLTYVDITAQKHSESELLRSQQALHEAQRIGRMGHWESDERTRTTHWSPAMFELLGRAPVTPVPFGTINSILTPDDLARYHELRRRSVETHTSFEFEFVGKRPDGSTFWATLHGSPRYDSPGVCIGMFGVLQIVTEQKLLEIQLRESRELLVQSQKLGRTGYVLADFEKNRSTWSDSLFEMRGIAPRESFSIEESVLVVHPDDRRSYLAQRQKAIDGHRSFNAEVRIVRPDGVEYWEQIAGHPRYAADGKLTGLMLIVQDITKRKVAENELKQANKKLAAIAATDGLTGLANRRHFNEVFAREWSRARRHCHPLSVLMIDVDYFKKYNDRYGHQAGDKCLADVAKILLRSAQRAADVPARYGGEEFVVIAPQTNQAQAYLLADKIRAGVHALDLPHADSPFQRVTVSVGAVSWTPDGTNSADGLLHAADEALYRAKNNGRNQAA